MPINRSLYPPTWPAISRRIRFERAGGRCERCGVQHGAVGYRARDGSFWTEEQIGQADGDHPFVGMDPKPVTAIITTAHLDRNPANSDEANLVALCMTCHLAYDLADNIQRRKRNRMQKWIDAGQREFSFKNNRD